MDFLDDIAEEKSFVQKDEDELLDLLSDDAAQEAENINIDEIDFDEIEPAESDEQPSQKEKLPVYEANYEENSQSDAVDFQEGDLVKHNKYGLGTVKKLMRHGNKKMYSINFEDFGRRLLDPEISQLEKIR